jgi:hypothetical protein
MATFGPYYVWVFDLNGGDFKFMDFSSEETETYSEGFITGGCTTTLFDHGSAVWCP